MDAITNTNNPQLIESRMGLYRLFRRLFETELDAEFLTFIQENNLNEFCEWLANDMQSLGNPERDKFLTELAAEFAFLFIGPGSHLPPYESVYVSKEKTLNGEATTQVRKFILMSGFDLDKSAHRYPDHICSELEFMERLLAHQLNAVNDGNQEELQKSIMLQQEFLRLHLSRWLPLFAKEIEQKAHLNFYKNLANMLVEFIKQEGEVLGILVAV